MLYIIPVGDSIPTLKRYNIKTTRVNKLVCSPQDRVLGIIATIAWCASSSKEGCGEWHCMQGVYRYNRASSVRVPSSIWATSHMHGNIVARAACCTSHFSNTTSDMQ